MRRLFPLLAILTVGSWLCPCPARADSAQEPDATAPAAGQPQAPVAVPPGAVPLIQDEPDMPGLPLHFRTMADPFPRDAVQPLPSRLGMDGLRASGSAQFSAAQLQTVVERVGRPLVVIDLRQESQGCR